MCSEIQVGMDLPQALTFSRHFSLTINMIDIKWACVDFSALKLGHK